MVCVARRHSGVNTDSCAAPCGGCIDENRGQPLTERTKKRRGMAGGEARLELISVLSICALPSSGHWGLCSLSHLFRWPSTAEWFWRIFGDPLMVRGCWWSLICLSKAMGIGERWDSGGDSGCQQGWLQKPIISGALGACFSG